MTYKNELLLEVADLLFLSIDGEISDEQFARLETLLNENSKAREYYFDLLLSTIGLNETEGMLTLAQSGVSIDRTDINIWKALAESERTAPGVEIEKEDKEPVKIQTEKTIKLERKISRLSLYSFIVSAAAMLFLAALILFKPVHPVVGTLTDSIDAEWINTKEVPVLDGIIRQGELTLSRGLAEITFGDGAVVVIEAPAVFEPQSPRSMFLTSGKVSAVVSRVATGFTVNTVNASIVDLGTEFGVSVEGNGLCSLQMFEGKANLIAGKEGKPKSTQIVIENQARSVDSISGQIKEISTQKEIFVRRIDSNSGLVWRGQDLNLADVVGGGNGFDGKGRIQGGIDPLTGRFMAYSQNLFREGDRKYHTVDNNPFIDGVFVPDGKFAPVTISSSGHIFADCPDTTNWLYSDIANGGKLSTGGTNEYLPIVMAGMEYGTKMHPAIIMHSNVGITFDLKELQKQVSDSEISRFQGKCCVSQLIPTSNASQPDPRISVYVLVDGKVIFEKTNLSIQDGESSIDIPLNQADRFLTLIVTDDEDTGNWNGAINDYGFIADPVLIFNQEFSKQ